MNTCSSCKWWKAWDEHGLRAIPIHICSNKKFTDDSYDNPNYMADDSLTFQYNEGGAFITGPNFGCIHHMQKE